MKWKILFAGFSFCFVPSVGSAQILLDEPFDYPSHAALAAAWNASSDNPTYQLDPSFGNPLPSYRMPSPASNFQGRLARNIPAGSVQATDANPLQLTYDLYLEASGAANGWLNARHFVELRGHDGGAFDSGTLQNVLAIGIYNNSFDTFSTNRYQGRVRPTDSCGPVAGCDWYTLDEELGASARSSGWHQLEILITGSEVRFTIDGVLAEVEPRPNSFAFDSIVLGSDLTANGHSVNIDNVSLSRLPIPEPGSAVLVIVAMLITRITRRQRC
jgi:hypothetical protein